MYSATLLHRVTGNLARSIQKIVAETPSAITAMVYSAGDVKYAAIHEYGGVIHHPGSYKFQVFKIGGKTIFTHGTVAHDIPIPMRSFMRTSLAENKEKIIASMNAAVLEGIMK